MTSYYKSVRPDGTDFRTGTVQWVPPEGHEGDWVVRHPSATKIGGDASKYLSVSTAATDCTGTGWPCRLLTVEAAGEVSTPSPTGFPAKRAGVAFRVTGELPAHEMFGPQGVHVVALIERARHLTSDEVHALAPAGSDAMGAVLRTARDAAGNVAGDAARDAARGAALETARRAAWQAALDAARDAAWCTARDAAWYVAGYAIAALIVRDLITANHYNTLTKPWASVIGKVHPDDPDLTNP